MTFPDLLAPDHTVPLLEECGLREGAAARAAAGFRRLAEILRDDGCPRETPLALRFVPGRIEVLGKHTDYAGGYSLTCAVERGFVFAAAPHADTTLRVTDACSGESVAFALDPALEPRQGHWAAYPMTVARRVARDFGGGLRGGHIVFASDLPSAAGLSSSSAFVVGLFQMLSALNLLHTHPFYHAHLDTSEALATYLGAVENGRPFGPAAGDLGVGTLGGNEDHTAILCAQIGRLGLYSYTPVQCHTSVPLPEGHVFALAASGVVAEKTGAARHLYNRLAQLAAHAVIAWNTALGTDHPHLGAILADPDFSPSHLHTLLHAYPDGPFPPADVFDRCMHFYAEHGRILPAAVQALESGDLATFGTLVDQSQSTAEQLLGNQIDETAFLASKARMLGAVAASAFGAGFGGAVWALVAERQAPEFLKHWQTRYHTAFPDHTGHARFFLECPGPCQFKL